MTCCLYYVGLSVTTGSQRLLAYLLNYFVFSFGLTHFTLMMNDTACVVCAVACCGVCVALITPHVRLLAFSFCVVFIYGIDAFNFFHVLLGVFFVSFRIGNSVQSIASKHSNVWILRQDTVNILPHHHCQFSACGCQPLVNEHFWSLQFIPVMVSCSTSHLHLYFPSVTSKLISLDSDSLQLILLRELTFRYLNDPGWKTMGVYCYWGNAFLHGHK